MRQRWKHVEQNGKGLASLGTKAAQQAQGKGWGRKQPVSLCSLPVPLAGPRHPSGHFLTSSEGRKEGGGSPG